MNAIFRAFSILAICLWASTAIAGSPTKDDYIGAGFKPGQATLLGSADISTFAVDANDNVIGGDGAGDSLTTGTDNVLLGDQAGKAITSGADNICIGEDACLSATTDARNVVIGSTAGDAIVGGGNDNVLVGNAAGSAITTGDGNICIGDETCTGLTTHGKNIQIGFEVGKSAYAAAADKLLIANSDDATPLIDGTLTAGSESLTLNVPRNLRVHGNGNIIKTLTVTNVDTQNDTMTVAEIVTGIYVHTSTTGGGTITTDTAANIIAGSSSVGALTANNDCYQTYFINDGDQTDTFAGGDGVTVSDTGNTIATNESAILLWCRTGAATMALHIIN